MADGGGLTTAGWVVSLGILALILCTVWRWPGTALSPAADIDKKYMGVPPPNENSSNGTKDGNSSSDSEYAARIASDHMYQGAPTPNV